jgi:hypothetical protein
MIILNLALLSVVCVFQLIKLGATIQAESDELNFNLVMCILLTVILAINISELRIKYG